MTRLSLKKLFWVAIGLFALTGGAYAAPAYTTGNVNMRSGPGTGYQKLTTLPAGTGIDVRRCAANWCNVRALGVSGWISASYVQAAQSSGRTIVIAPRVIVRPPHYRPPHAHRPNRPRPPHWNRPGKPTCRIAPGYPCPR
uniref:SH3 type 3 domain-containing protein n=2 Tax=Ochrobactrum sp. LM19 TaxID=1449781 RepID=A0A0D5A037_9HYPH|nr:SH3 type 3 domain-containing protein [Ochrobactrum sp. LM19]